MNYSDRYSRSEHQDHSYPPRREGFHPHDKLRGSSTQRYEERRVEPQPIGEKCNPLCPLFTCTRNALMVTFKPVRGRTVRVAVCRLTGEECIGGECQYASCRLNVLLPDGRCAKALEKKAKRLSDEDMFKEIKRIEDYDAHEFIR